MNMASCTPNEANDATMALIREFAVAPEDWVAVPAPQFRIPMKPVALQGADGPGGEDILTDRDCGLCDSGSVGEGITQTGCYY